MRSSIIVPAYNASPTIEACLAALVNQTEPRTNYEIIVVDDGSSDATSERAARVPGVRVVQSTHRGPAAARNRGVLEARGDIILFTDADCAPTRTWVQAMLAPFADPQVAGAKGTYRSHQTRLVARFVQIEYEDKHARMRNVSSIDFVDTFSAAYRRQVLLRCKGFDEAFPSASVEDQELSFRLAAQGARLVFVPEAVVYHSHVETLSAYARRKFLIGYWKVKVHRQHPGKLWSDSHTPFTQRAQVLIFLLALMAVLTSPSAPVMLWLAVGLFAGLCLSSLPLLIFAARRDPAVALATPGMVVLRAGALSVGLVIGVFGEIWRGIRRTIQPMPSMPV